MACRPIDPTLDTHYKTVIKALTDNRVVPFFGAGVNLCDRPQGQNWTPQSMQYLPSGSELSKYLADNFNCDLSDRTDLVRVSQYIALMDGSGPLYDLLHRVFDRDYPPTRLHRFFAQLPSRLRGKGYQSASQLIVTTNYDDVLERAFQAAGEPFDVVSYISEGEMRGKFMHVKPDGSSVPIDRPNEYRELSLDRRSVILKIHGAVYRSAPDQDSYVITEDHYIDYLTRTDLSNLVPVTLAAKLRRCNFLFLGYGLRDWNLRVILHRISREQKLSWRSWAIQLNPSPLDERFWDSRNVEILPVPLERYIGVLEGRLKLIPALAPIAANANAK
jgi:SIR2-like domain